MKTLLARKFKDERLLELLDLIIDSTKGNGLPLGNASSQWLANFYLSGLDHYIKEHLKVKYYLRYNDDLVILDNSKEVLHKLRVDISDYLKNNLKLVLGKYQVFPIEVRGIDYLGYVSRRGHIRLRKSIKKDFIAMIRRNYNNKSMASYWGWIKHCNGINLWNKYE